MKWVTTPYNLYLKLADGRFLTLFRAGNTIDVDRLSKYAVKGITTLFASEQELIDAVSAEVALATQDQRVEVLNKVSHAVFEELKTLGIAEATYNHAKSVSKVVRNMIDKEPKLSDAFIKFGEMDANLVRHSVLVSAMSTILCSAMEWIKPATVENVALGALLHDVGKTSLPPEILAKDRQKLSEAERMLLDGHAEAGRALLAQVKTVPEDVSMIIAHHHERSDGSGYPQGLKDIYIHPLARVVALANELVERYEEDRASGRSTSVRILVETLLNAQASKFNRDVIKSVRQLLTSEALF